MNSNDTPQQHFQHQPFAAREVGSNASLTSGDDDVDDLDVHESQNAGGVAARGRAAVETTSTYNRYDVLLGRGRAYQLYPGNRRFHGMINSNAERYANSSAQSGKWKITMEIVGAVLAKGRFLKANKDRGWTVIPRETARQKVAHALQYQNRQLIKKSLKKSQTGPSQDIDDGDGSDQLAMDPSDHEHDLSAYPNISRTYFSDPAAAAAAKKVSESATASDKFFHGATGPVAVAHAAPTMQAQASINPAPINVANSAIEAPQKVSFSGFRSLPFYNSVSAVNPSHAGIPDCAMKDDSNPTIAPHPVERAFRPPSMTTNPKSGFDAARIVPTAPTAEETAFPSLGPAVAPSAQHALNRGIGSTQSDSWENLMQLIRTSDDNSGGEDLSAPCVERAVAGQSHDRQTHFASPTGPPPVDMLRTEAPTHYAPPSPLPFLKPLPQAIQQPSRLPPTFFPIDETDPAVTGPKPSHRFEDQRASFALRSPDISLIGAMAPNAHVASLPTLHSMHHTLPQPQLHAPPHTQTLQATTAMTTRPPPKFFPIDETDTGIGIGNGIGEGIGDLSSLDLYEQLEDDFQREQGQRHAAAPSDDPAKPNRPFWDG